MFHIVWVCVASDVSHCVHLCYAVVRPVVHKDVEFVKHNGVNGEFGNTGLIVGVGSVESSFLIQWTKGMTDFEDPDYPSVLVFIQYLTQVEGPMWREIRGQGLSYNYGY